MLKKVHGTADKFLSQKRKANSGFVRGTLSGKGGATILDKTLETIPANITKLLNIDKTNFAPPPPPPQFNVVNNAETTFGNIP
jgi:hypothetical protein